MASRRNRLCAAFLAAAMLMPYQVLGQESGVSAAKQTVEEQLRAFQGDDGKTAYSFAAPNIRRMFPSVESFMAMVETGYEPVRRPRDFAFGKTRVAGGVVSQQVILTGPDGKTCEALYTLELQPDGIWRITSVSLRERRIAGA